MHSIAPLHILKMRLYILRADLQLMLDRFLQLLDSSLDGLERPPHPQSAEMQTHSNNSDAKVWDDSEALSRSVHRTLRDMPHDNPSGAEMIAETPKYFPRISSPLFCFFGVPLFSTNQAKKDNCCRPRLDAGGKWQPVECREVLQSAAGDST